MTAFVSNSITGIISEWQYSSLTLVWDLEGSTDSNELKLIKTLESKLDCRECLANRTDKNWNELKWKYKIKYQK